MKRSVWITYAAIIAALYVVLTFSFMFMSKDVLQLRVAEALTILPVFTSAAIPGLFVGCLISNIILGATVVDIMFGSLATLLAAILTYKLKNRKWLAPLPPVLVNAIIVGGYLEGLYSMGSAAHGFFQAISPVALPEMPLIYSMLLVGVGQVGACYLIGMPLMFLLNKYKNVIFNYKMRGEQ